MLGKKEKTTKESLNKELELFKADVERQKQQFNKELELYKEEKLLDIEKDIQDRKQQNWVALDETRRESYQQIALINAEIAKLEGQRDSLKTIISKNQSEEIARLNNIVLELIKNQNKQIICQSQK